MLCLTYIKITLFTNHNVYNSHYVQLIYKSHCVQITLCTNHIMYKSHYVQITLCATHIVYKSPYVQITFYTNHIAYNSHCVQITLCTNHILYKSHCIQLILCTNHITNKSQYIYICTTHIMNGVFSKWTQSFVDLRMRECLKMLWIVKLFPINSLNHVKFMKNFLEIQCLILFTDEAYNIRNLMAIVN